jgi:two-component system NtrC family sensor kinase
LRQATSELGGARSLVVVALRAKGVFLGHMAICRQEVCPFTDKEIRLLQNFAAQAVVAMENARLLSETREALDQQIATAQVVRIINSSPGNLAPVFEAVLEKAIRLCNANFGVLLTYDDDRFDLAALHNAPEAYAAFMLNDPPQPGPKTAMGRILRGECVVRVEDAGNSEAYRLGDPRRRAFVDLAGARSYVCVGLFAEDKLIGTLGAYREDVRPFSDKEITLLEGFAAQAVIAMENARLLGELRQRTDEIAGWNANWKHESPRSSTNWGASSI